MIEKYQGYTAVRKVGQGFRPVGKHSFKMIHNARAVKISLIQQFEASTGIIFTKWSGKRLRHAASTDFR